MVFDMFHRFAGNPTCYLHRFSLSPSSQVTNLWADPEGDKDVLGGRCGQHSWQSRLLSDSMKSVAKVGIGAFGRGRGGMSS